MKLVYHSKASIETSESPFVESLSKFDGADPLYLVCPYISFSFFASLVNRSNSWRLITDLGEWFAVTPTKQLSLIHRLIKAEGNNIRHHSGVHAKVFWRAERALIGSANLTEKGLLARTEFGVELTTPTDLAAIAEVKEWYEWLWQQSVPAATVNLGLVMMGRAESIKPNDKTQDRRTTIRELAQGTLQDESPLLTHTKDRFEVVQRVRIVKSVATQDVTTISAEFPQLAMEVPDSQSLKNGAPTLTEIGALLSPENRIVAQAIAVVEFLAETIDPQGGFSMAEVSSIFDEQLADFSIRDLYFALSRSASNHPRGAFTLDAKHLLWVDSDGRFHQSIPQKELFSRVDRILCATVDSIATNGYVERSKLAVACNTPRAQIDASLIALSECGFLRMYESRRGEYISDDEAGADVDVLFTTAQDRCRSALNRSFNWPAVWNEHFSIASQRWIAAISNKSNTFSFVNNERVATSPITYNFLNRPRASAAKIDRRRAKRIWQIIARQLQNQQRIEYNQQWRDTVATEGRESTAFVESLVYKWQVAGKLDFQREGQLEFFSLKINDNPSAGSQ